MILFLIFIILILGIIVLISLFAPHKLPWYRPHLIISSSEITPMDQPVAISKVMLEEKLVSSDVEFKLSLKEQVSKLEIILGEKNRLIEKLQKELSSQKDQRFEFDKVQSLLNQQIEELKNKNKKLKSQIGETNE